MKKVQERQDDRRDESYRRMLLDRRAEVLSSLGVKFETLAALGRVAEEDQAQIYHDEFISFSLNTLDYQQLGLIEEALERISGGEYGLCLACGDPIPAKRLRAVPWARYCVPCQERENLAALNGEGGSSELAADL